jgi:hypothetical protein
MWARKAYDVLRAAEIGEAADVLTDEAQLLISPTLFSLIRLPRRQISPPLHTRAAAQTVTHYYFSVLNCTSHKATNVTILRGGTTSERLFSAKRDEGSCRGF